MPSVLKPLFKQLADECRADPSLAAGEMRAVCDSAPQDPLRWTVTGSPGSQTEMAIGQHPSIGGDGSAPCPGELVTMALAACMDGTIRMLADILEIELDRLRVEVVNRGDIRDILRAQDVRPPDDVGFRMTMEIEAPGATPEAVEKLKKAAVASSAVLNMLRDGTPVDVTWS
jgi:uncharacterized OsmC-like protein